MATSRFCGATGLRSACRFFGPSVLLLAALALFSPATVAGPPTKPVSPPNPRMSMVIEGRGTIIIELDAKTAPKSCAHIMELAKKGFYDRMLFHRVVTDFVAQTGDPGSKKIDGAQLRDLTDDQVAARFGLGGGGSGSTVPLEPGGIHDRGTLGMARSQSVDSNDSQFFFNLTPNHSLDYNYTQLGKVVSGIEELSKPKPGEKQDKTMTLARGMKVMDSIRQGDRITSFRPFAPEKSAPAKK